MPIKMRPNNLHQVEDKINIYFFRKLLHFRTLRVTYFKSLPYKNTTAARITAVISLVGCRDDHAVYIIWATSCEKLSQFQQKVSYTYSRCLYYRKLPRTSTISIFCLASFRSGRKLLSCAWLLFSRAALTGTLTRPFPWSSSNFHVHTICAPAATTEHKNETMSHICQSPSVNSLIHVVTVVISLLHSNMIYFTLTFVTLPISVSWKTFC